MCVSVDEVSQFPKLKNRNGSKVKPARVEAIDPVVSVGPDL